MATRRAFSKQDQSNVVDWMVKHHPQKENRRGNVVWKLLADDKNAHPWNNRHTWQSWRERYIDNMAHYDILIAKKYRAIHGDTANPNNTTTAAPPASDSFPPKRPTNKPSQSQQSSATPSAPDPATRPVHLTVPSYRRRPPSPQSNVNSPVQIARDIKHLAQYFDIYGIAEHIRARADIFHDLKRSEATSAWSSSRSALEWRDLYTTNKMEVDNLVQGGGSDNHSSRVNGMAAPRIRKRLREEERQTSATETLPETSRLSPQGVNGVKKRRLNGTGRSADPFRPPTPPDRPAPPHATALPTRRTSVVLAPETSSVSNTSREATPVAQSKPNFTGTSAFVLKTIASALKSAYSADLGPYGIKGSPIGSTTSDPPSPEAPPSGAFGNEKTMSREIILTPEHGEGNGAELDAMTPDADAARRKSVVSTSLKGGSISPQGSQETPKGGLSGNLPQEIFPRTLPHLTPPLRPGSHGESKYITKDDTAFFAGHHFNDDQEDPVFPKVLPNLTPALRPGPHGETSYVIQDQSIQYLENNKDRSRPATPQESRSALDDDELEGPSPMPYLGSDRHSSRSYSFSHGQEDTLPGPLLKGLAKALSNQLLQEDSTDTQEVDELANDIDDEEEAEGPKEPPGPRYIVPTKRPRHSSDSPLFASSSASDNEGCAAQTKSTTATVHYPVKAKVKAKGVVRMRGRKGNDQGMKLDEDEDSESDSQPGVGDSDKENANVVEDFGMFQNDSPPAIGEDSPVAFQNEMDETPDFHSSPKSLHFSGKTPPSPNVTATSIKPQVHRDHIPPATAPVASKSAAVMPKKYRKGFPTFDSGDRSEEMLLKAALSYPSPNIPSELEEALQRKEEPSPLQRLAEKAMAGKVAKNDDHISDVEGHRHGKVRFDGVALDRDRRKTTGGIGFVFGGGGSRGIVSDAVAGPSHSRFKAAPALFGSQRRSAGRTIAGSQDIHLKRNNVEVLDLGDEEEEQNESPLARYSAPSRLVTSPLKSQQGHAESDQTARSSSQGPARSTAARFPPPPTPVRVPVIASSSSPLPGSSPPTRRAVRKEDVGSVSTREFATAMWSPIRFGQASGSQAERHGGGETLAASGSWQAISGTAPAWGAFRPGFVAEPGQGLSIGFRDQNADAEWVASVRGRPSITSKKIDPRRRSAPIPSDGDVVVYSSRSPSRARSGSRRTPTSAGDGGLRDISTVDALAGISEADKQRVLAWLEDNRNLDQPPEHESGDDLDEAGKIFEGLGLMFEMMAANSGFAVSVPRNVWKQCGDLSETAAIVQAMTDSANATGLEELEMRQQRIVQNAMDTREAILSGEVDGRRRSGRFSGRYSHSVRGDPFAGTSTNAGRGAESGAAISANIGVASSTRKFDTGYEANGRSRSDRTSRSKSGDGRQPRPRPPSYVPAEVVEPLLSWHS